ncbi:hypothetical protein IMZ48_41795 [Candidatus Bathyarchaeota archaeon]|nr:hypothetical protein [Candidatus Bathyarchaeota archaeon]
MSEREGAISSSKAALESLPSLESDRVMSSTFTNKAAALDMDTMTCHGDIEQHATPQKQQNGPSDQPIASLMGSSARRYTYNRSLRKRPAVSSHDYQSHSTGLSPPSASEPSTSAPQEVKQEECIACRDEVEPSRLVRCPCSHKYCHGCLAELYKAAAKDRSTFPPRCCKLPIPIEANKAYLPPDVVAEVKVKEVEYSKPSTGIRCHNAICSSSIPSEAIKGGIARCQACRARTCLFCEGKRHANACLEDLTSQEVLRIASEKG